MSAPPGHSMVFRKLQKGGLTISIAQKSGENGEIRLAALRRRGFEPRSDG